MVRWFAYVALGLVTVVLVAAVTVFLLLDRFDLAALAASRASAALGRPVAVSALHVTPGRWLGVDLQGVTVANIAGGSRPEMAKLAHLTAEIEAWSVLYGPLQVRTLTIDGLSVLLERTADGTPNWRRTGAAPKPTTAEDRSGVPTLLDVRIRGSEITDHTTSGQELQIRFDDGTLRTASADAPVRVEITGAYRAIPVSLTAELQSIAALRQTAIPYGTNFQLTSGDTTLHFDGTMTKPLAIDGANGTLTLHAPTITTVLAVTGAKASFAASLDLAGKLTRDDALWVLTDAVGQLDDSTVAASTLRLTDGGRGHPDQIDLDLAFDRLNVDKLLAGKGTSKDAKPFSVAAEPDPKLGARLTAHQVIYQSIQGTDLKLAAAVTPGRIEVSELAVTAFGAHLQASAHAEAIDKGDRLAAAAALSGVDVQQLRRQIGAREIPLTGRLEAELSADGAGANLDAAMQAAHVAAIVSMRGGSLSRDVVEKASTDIRQVFRKPEGMTPVSCLLGVIDMRAGVGTISALRIRTADGTLAGQGRFDLNRQAIDVTVGSQSATTSDFALDVPFRISGRISDPDIRPSTDKPAFAVADFSKLPAGLGQSARRNPCATAR